MNTRLATLGFYLVAATLSAGLAGIAGGVLALTYLGGLTGLYASLLISPYSAWIGVKWLLLPTLFVGAGLGELGKRRPAWQHIWVWAVAGAAAGLAMLVFPWPGVVKDTARDPDLAVQGLIEAIFALSGVAGALVFRTAAWWNDLFPDQAAGETTLRPA